MNNAIVLPPWAAGAFVALFFGAVTLACWGFKALGARVLASIARVDGKVEELRITFGEIDKRVVRIETLVNGTARGAARFPRQSTPPPME